MKPYICPIIAFICLNAEDPISTTIGGGSSNGTSQEKARAPKRAGAPYTIL